MKVNKKKSVYKLIDKLLDYKYLIEDINVLSDGLITDIISLFIKIFDTNIKKLNIHEFLAI